MSAALKISNSFKAIILAGGSADYLDPLHENVALLPVLDKPLISYQIRLLERSGFNEAIVICSSHQEESISLLLDDTDGLSREAFNVQVLATDQYEVCSAIRELTANGRLKLEGCDFIVLPCDLISTISLNRLCAFHRLRRSTMTAMFSQPWQGYPVFPDPTPLVTDAPAAGGKKGNKKEAKASASAPTKKDPTNDIHWRDIIASSPSIDEDQDDAAAAAAAAAASAAALATSSGDNHSRSKKLHVTSDLVKEQRVLSDKLYIEGEDDTTLVVGIQQEDGQLVYLREMYPPDMTNDSNHSGGNQSIQIHNDIFATCHSFSLHTNLNSPYIFAFSPHVIEILQQFTEIDNFKQLSGFLVGMQFVLKNAAKLVSQRLLAPYFVSDTHQSLSQQNSAINQVSSQATNSTASALTAASSAGSNPNNTSVASNERYLSTATMLSQQSTSAVDNSDDLLPLDQRQDLPIDRRSFRPFDILSGLYLMQSRAQPLQFDTDAALQLAGPSVLSASAAATTTTSSDTKHDFFVRTTMTYLSSLFSFPLSTISCYAILVPYHECVHRCNTLIRYRVFNEVLSKINAPDHHAVYSSLSLQKNSIENVIARTIATENAAVVKIIQPALDKLVAAAAAQEQNDAPESASAQNAHPEQNITNDQYLQRELQVIHAYVGACSGHVKKGKPAKAAKGAAAGGNDSTVQTAVESFDPSWPKVLPYSKIENSWSASDVQISNATVINSILANHSRIYPGAIVKNSIVLQYATIEENAVVENCIIGPEFVVTRDTTVSGDTLATSSREILSELGDARNFVMW